VIRDKAVEESLKRLEKVCETLEERSVSEQIARIWWIVGALIESVSRQQLELGVSIKSLLGKVDAIFRVILIIGERGLLQRQPIELIKNFLYYIAQPECDGPKTQAIKTAYRLEHFLPSESARSEVLDNIAGPNQALLKTVAEAMKAEIETVKSTLEVYVNGDLSQVDALKDLPQEMHIISDTLARPMRSNCCQWPLNSCRSSRRSTRCRNVSPAMRSNPDPNPMCRSTTKWIAS